MSDQTRKRLLRDIREATGHTNHDALMDFLQDRGVVSDNAVTLNDVPDSDLKDARDSIASTTTGKAVRP